jgi:hypothetical protein
MLRIVGIAVRLANVPALSRKNYDRWVKAGKHGKFIHFLGRVYCPVGAKNDPKGLNVHWIRNVSKFVSRFK